MSASALRARRELPRSWSLLLALLAAGTALLLVTSYPVLHVYTRHFLGAPPAVDVDLRALSPDMTEPDVIRQFRGAMLTCNHEQRIGGDNLGERVCYGALDSFGGVPALTLALFFHRGRLAQAVVHVPWWAHHRMAGKLAASLGPPGILEERMKKGGDRLIQWETGNGKIVFNRDPGYHPLRWSAVFWMPK